MSREKIIGEEIATNLASSVFSGGPTPVFMWIPQINREEISSETVIVSVAERDPQRLTRKSLVHAIGIDVGIGKPLGSDPDAVCEAMMARADAVIDALAEMVLSSGRIATITQPIVIDPEYYRQKRFAFTVVRASVRSY